VWYIEAEKWAIRVQVSAAACRRSLSKAPIFKVKQREPNPFVGSALSLTPSGNLGLQFRISKVQGCIVEAHV
jgi:hypothetical protein